MFVSGDAANWNSVQFGKVRVSVETVSPSGLVALVKGPFGERWAVIEKLSKAMGRKPATPAAPNSARKVAAVVDRIEKGVPRTRITKTDTGRKAEMADGTSVELVSKPRKRAPRKAVQEF